MNGHGGMDAGASWSEDRLRRIDEGGTKGPVAWLSTAATLADADAMVSDVFGDFRVENSVRRLGLPASEAKPRRQARGASERLMEEGHTIYPGVWYTVQTQGFASGHTRHIF